MPYLLNAPIMPYNSFKCNYTPLQSTYNPYKCTYNPLPCPYNPPDGPPGEELGGRHRHRHFLAELRVQPRVVRSANRRHQGPKALRSYSRGIFMDDSGVFYESYSLELTIRPIRTLNYPV